MTYLYRDNEIRSRNGPEARMHQGLIQIEHQTRLAMIIRMQLGQEFGTICIDLWFQFFFSCGL